MVEREPDYASYTFEQLLDVESRIDRTSYPERWNRLQQELIARRNGSAPRDGVPPAQRDGRPAPAERDLSPAPLMGRTGYVMTHFVFCPILAGIGACFVDGEGEGAGCLPLLAVPLMAMLSLSSIGTFSVYRIARNPGRFLLISIFVTALVAPLLYVLALSLLLAIIEWFQ